MRSDEELGESSELPPPPPGLIRWCELRGVGAALTVASNFVKDGRPPRGGEELRLPEHFTDHAAAVDDADRTADAAEILLVGVNLDRVADRLQQVRHSDGTIRNVRS